MSWEQNVRRVVPYVAGEQPNKPGMIKLNTNECPYPPAPGVERLLKRMDYGALRLYPDPDTGVLVDALAEYYHVSPGQVFVGVGSDDVISMAFMTFFNGRRPILFPDVTYSFYDVWAKLHGIPYRTCPLDEDWHICPEDYRQPNGGIIFPNPNAPTGLFESLETVERIVRANRDVVVMVDEAYVDFGGRSALPLVEKYDNLLVVQTFSKSRSMAGLRIGFCIGSEKLIGYLNDVKFSFNSYTMNLPSQLLGAEAVQMGTRFIVARESVVHENYKKKVIGARDIDSEVTGMSHGHPVRQLRNKMTREYVKLEKEGAPFEELEQLTLGALRKAVVEGDVVNGTLMAGQCAGLVQKEQTCEEMIREIMEQAEKLLSPRS